MSHYIQRELTDCLRWTICVQILWINFCSVLLKPARSKTNTDSITPSPDTLKNKIVEERTTKLVCFFLSRKMGHYWIIIKARVTRLDIDMRIVTRDMCTEFLLKMLNVFFSYVLRLTFRDSDDEEAKGITITRLLFFENQTG